jgi:uncharacterized membrane protein
VVEIIPNWHPIFVHFTVALLSVATGLYLVTLLLANGELRVQWLIVARWNLWLGMGLTLITVLSGVYAYNTVAHDAPSHLAMTDHRNWAIATAILFAAATTWSIFSYRSGKEVSVLFMALLLVATISLASTAWRGGEVVYRYGLGVMSLPNMGNHEHSDGEEEHAHSGSDGEGNHHDKIEGLLSDKAAVRPQEEQNNQKVEMHKHPEGSESHAH